MKWSVPKKAIPVLNLQVMRLMTYKAQVLGLQFGRRTATQEMTIKYVKTQSPTLIINRGCLDRNVTPPPPPDDIVSAIMFITFSGQRRKAGLGHLIGTICIYFSHIYS